MVLRRFTWDDLPFLVTLLNAVRRSEGNHILVEPVYLGEQLAAPGLAPEENCRLIETDGRLVGYFLLHPELRVGRTVLDLAIDPAYRGQGLERTLVRAALDRARELKASVLHLEVPSPLPFWQGLLGSEGLQPVRCYWTMRWEGGDLTPATPPKGYFFRSSGQGDAETLTRVQNASFAGSWGFCPNTVEEVRYRAGMSICRPEGILFLTDGSAVAGYCWACVYGEGAMAMGVISMIGIEPSFRGKGLSKPLLLAGLAYLASRRVQCVELNVDSQNAPAIGLYLSTGFKKVSERHWFEARLDASSLAG